MSEYEVISIIIAAISLILTVIGIVVKLIIELFHSTKK